jgi:dolichol kinase
MGPKAMDDSGERPPAEGQKSGRGELAFILASAAIFLAIAGCVVYFVARIII